MLSHTVLLPSCSLRVCVAGPVQKALGIAKEACYIVQAKNPTITTSEELPVLVGWPRWCSCFCLCRRVCCIAAATHFIR